MSVEEVSDLIFLRVFLIFSSCDLINSGWFKKYVTELNISLALHFNKHKLVNRSISLGSAINYDKKIKNNLYSTFLDIEFIEDLTKKKKSKLILPLIQARLTYIV